jgi:hypothetical protein
MILKNSSTSGYLSKTVTMRFQGTDTSGNVKEAASISIHPVASDYRNASIRFYTRENDAPALKMLIQSNGYVGIGTLATANYQLHLSTDSAAKPTTNTWTIGSDKRIKEDIVDADISLCYNISKLLKLKYFKWSEKYCSDYADRHSLGFIAQDVKEYFPNAVGIRDAEFVIGKDASGNDIKETIPGFHDLNTDQLLKLQWGTITKLIEDKEQLETTVEFLETKINTMKSQMDELKANVALLMTKI